MNLTNHKLCFFSSPFSIIEPFHERNVSKIKIYQTFSNIFTMLRLTSILNEIDL